MVFDYATLKLLWWFIILALFIVFCMLGGRDFGVSILLPWVSDSDDERRVVINSIGSTWEANQVWFITFAAAIFAAWPIVYATSFTALYAALFLVLFTLIIRPPGIEYRSKLPSKAWRQTWDCALFLSGIVPALILGVALGNIFLGLPFHFDDNLMPHYEGGFIQLLNPFSILFGLASISILAFHGSIFLQKKLPAEYGERLKKFHILFGWGFIVLFVLIGMWIVWGVNGYHIDAMLDVNHAMNPPQKQVSVVLQGWLSNYHQYPALWVLPVVTVLAVILAMIAALNVASTLAWLLSALSLVAALLTASAALFPFILPSLTHPQHSITLWDGTSSHRTLQYMFWAVVIFLPLIVAYSSWVFSVLSGKLNKEDLKRVESY